MYCDQTCPKGYAQSIVFEKFISFQHLFLPHFIIERLSLRKIMDATNTKPSLVNMVDGEKYGLAPKPAPVVEGQKSSSQSQDQNYSIHWMVRLEILPYSHFSSCLGEQFESCMPALSHELSGNGEAGIKNSCNA